MKSGPVSIRMFTKTLKRPTETKRRRLSASAPLISRSPFRHSDIEPLPYGLTDRVIFLGVPAGAPAPLVPGGSNAVSLGIGAGVSAFNAGPGIIILWLP